MFIIGKQAKNTANTVVCSNSPVPHADYPSAVVESERLARAHPEFRFIVFQAVATSEAQPIPVKTVSFPYGTN